ncbi:hypothetical protein KAJ27_13420, partial [bacterium]|nr:hypothetical protein [bacterium]
MPNKLLYIFIILILTTSVANAFPGGQRESCIKSPNTKAGRPSDLPERYLSSDKHFLMHYTNSGRDSVAQIYNIEKEVPDYIVNAGLYLEKSWRLHHDTLNFLQPPVDNASSPETDVYFSNLGSGWYGGTTPEYEVVSTSRPHDYTSYMEIHNSFAGPSFFTNGEEALKVTCAHEYFHVVQLGYGLWNWTDDEIWFLEASSVWMEERAFPEVDDYFQYFDSYSSNWGQPIDSYYYDNAGFAMMLEKKEIGAMLNIWTNILSEKVQPSIEKYLKNQYSGEPWSTVLSDYALSMAACGDPAASEFSVFSDAPDLPSIQIPAGYYIPSYFLDT